MTARLALIGLLLGLTAPPAMAAPDLVKAPAETQQRYGVRTAPLAAGRSDPAVVGYARVLDTGPLAMLANELDAAEAAAAASRAEAARTRALHAADAAVSGKVAEAAQAQARTDAARVALARRRLGLEWGPAIARLSDRARAALVEDLAAGRVALVRIDTPAGQGLAGARSATIEGAPGRAAVRAQVLGPARTAEARLQSGGLLARVSGPDAAWFSAGLTARARLDVGAGQAGVLVPRAALIRWRGGTWAYVRRGPESFERRAVTGSMVEDGLLAPAGFAVGEAVVVAGAGALFAIEQAPPAKDEDD